MSNVIGATQLHKSYRDGQIDLPVLRALSLNIDKGERVCILGRSGSGKSTLLHILAGLLNTDSGDVVVAEQSMSNANSSARAALRNKYMGFVYQFHHLLPEFTALENVAMPLLLGKVPLNEAEHRARELLNDVGLIERTDHLPSQLSGGEKLRVAVCRAMVARPLVVLADEPTGNLDGINADQVMVLMRNMSEEFGTAFIVVSHDEDISKYMTRMLVLDNGKLTPYAE